jgi:hypothetical protein
MLSLLSFLQQATAQQGQTAEPTRDQLQIQINIMRDYIKQLEAKLQAAAAAPVPAPDSDLVQAQKIAQLRELQYAKEKYDIALDGYRESLWSNRISLAIVVLMVFAGITFSGFQLWKSVNVGRIAEPLKVAAASEKSEGGGGGLASSDVEISPSHIRITSTVVGVLVLVISIAFFYIYTKDHTGVTVAGDVDVEHAAASK